MKIRTSLIGLAFLAAPALAQTPTWKAEFIGAVPAAWTGSTLAADFNDAGQVVGRTTLALTYQAWYGEIGGGELQLLPVPAGTDYSEATAINSNGLIGGTVRIGGAYLGCIWKPTASGPQPMLLPAAANGWLPASVTAINDHDDVVGRYGPLSRPYHWSEATGTTGLPYPEYHMVPKDINNERQVIADTWRMDLDNLIVEDLGNPVGVGYSFQFTKLSLINDGGDCAGYGVTGSSSENFLPVRYTEGGSWKAFSSFPLSTANVLGLASSGDVTYQLGIFGTYLYVDGIGSLALGSILDPSSTEVDVSGVLTGLSRAGRLLANGTEVATGKTGLALLSPASFDDLGGASAGSLGTPILGGFGDLTPGSPTRLRLSSAAKGSLAIMVWSTSSVPLPIFGGVLHPFPFVGSQTLPIDPTGRIDLTSPWPGLPVGTPLYLQAAVLDPGTFGAFALSNGLRGTTR